MNKKEWFGEWFDSPYYHILYRHRDNKEAQHFIGNLIEHLAPNQDAKILDLACGKGRHSIYLNKIGLNVEGVDLSKQNIAMAKPFENSRLKFSVHDMREVYKSNHFDLILNLFTSFGYFDTKEEHAQAIKAIAQSLQPGGKFLIDFLNPYVVVNNLVSAETKEIDGVKFVISRRFENDFIIKDIHIEDKGEKLLFQERVKAIRRTEFLSYFEAAGLSVLDRFGNYELGSYEKEKSERLIFLTQKVS